MSQNLEARLREAIIDVPNFPKPGIIFKDITPILHDPELRADTIAAFGEHYAESGVTAVAGPESRGFIFGVLLAEHLGVPFVPIRKPGKLPREAASAETTNDVWRTVQGLNCFRTPAGSSRSGRLPG